MATPLPLLRRPSSRSCFIFKSILKGASEPDADLMPAGEGVFLSWTSSGVSYEKTPVHDLPVRDLTSGGLTGFRPLLGGCYLEGPLGDWLLFCLHLEHLEEL